MAIGPERAARTVETLDDWTDWLEIQIDAFLTGEWKNPSRTCFHVPSYLQHKPWYDEMLERVIAKYRPMWPHLHRFSSPAYTCDFLAFVTEADNEVAA